MSPPMCCLNIHTWLRKSWWIWNFICSRFPKRGSGAGPGGSCLRFRCIPRNCMSRREAAKHTSTTLTVNISLLIYTVSLSLKNCYVKRGQIHLSCSAGTSPRRKCADFRSSFFITFLYLLIPENNMLLSCMWHCSITLQPQIQQVLVLQGIPNAANYTLRPRNKNPC